MSAEAALTNAVTLHDYMAVANAAYYGSRDPLGAGGDFITAPEISQMFGELIGLWAADLVLRADAADFAWVELGPGRGTLSADALRAMAGAKLAPPVHLVETSPTLRGKQAEKMPAAQWHESIDTLPTDRPLIVVANEFFDALPIRQYVRAAAGWREQMVVPDLLRGATAHRTVLGAADCAQEIPIALSDAPLGAVVERCPAGEAIVAELARRIVQQGGALLVVDYGYEGPATGDTLQAMSAHAFADPFESPGTRDLTAHVDFAMLAATGRLHGARPGPVVPQGAFLQALGIAARAQGLARANPARAGDVKAALDRLVAPAAMGRLFKVLCLRAPGWPAPAGFA